MAQESMKKANPFMLTTTLGRGDRGQDRADTICKDPQRWQPVGMLCE